MPAERLYLEDPYLKEWLATVTGVKKFSGKTLVTLDRTAFHPQGGGQPGDRGTIGGLAIVDTFVHDGEVIHELSEGADPPFGEVECAIDWSFREPLMRLHTGEHLLFSCLKALKPDLEVDKVLFSLEGGKLFVSGSDLSFEDVSSAEERANSLIASGVPVRSHFFDGVEAAKAALPQARLKEERVSGRIRILEIEGTDYSACSGTHLRNTKEIGFLKILWVNRNGGATELTFGAGEQAVMRTRELANKVVEAGLALQVEPEKVVPTILNARAENLRLRQTVRALSKEVLKGAKASVAPEKLGGVRAYVASFDGLIDRQDLSELANHFVKKGTCVAVLFGGLDPEFSSLVLAASGDFRGDLNKLAARILPLVGGRGGGRPLFVSAACRERGKIPAALSAARDWLASISPSS